MLITPPNSVLSMSLLGPLRLAYYCSGHGYGHATRVTAVSCHLLTLKNPERLVDITIVSTAPAHVFTECLAIGANYRYAEVDPVISQPIAYRYVVVNAGVLAKHKHPRVTYAIHCPASIGVRAWKFSGPS